jgi:E3 ubiquitin-protein ligase TRIP12
MDLPSFHNQQATSSTSSSSSHPSLTLQVQQQFSIDHSTSFPESRALRSSARVKAAKQKELEKDNGKERDAAEQASSSASSLPVDSISSRAIRSSPASKHRRTRDTDVKGKGKAKDSSDESSARSSKRYAQSL